MRMARRRSRPEFLEHACIATRMIDKRRQLFDLQLKVNAEKAKYHEQCQSLCRDEEDFQRRDLEFKQSLVKFEAFSKKNESIYKRATKRLSDETKLCEAKEKEVDILLSLLEEKTAESKCLQSLVNRRRRYHEYLESSTNQLNLTKSCTEASDVLDQYESLKKTNSTRREKQARLESKISELLSSQDGEIPEKIIAVEGIEDAPLCIQKLAEHLRRREDRNDFDIDAKSSFDSNTAIEYMNEVEELIKAYGDVIAVWEQKNKEMSSLL